MSAPASQSLWSRLAAAGIVSGEMPAAPDSQTPWYVRLMLGIAGLIAALFLLGAVITAFMFVVQSGVASVAVGGMLIVAAFAIFRAVPESDFGSMFALAVSFAGQALLLIGFFDLFGVGKGSHLPLAIAAVESVLAAVMPNFIHRLVSACIGAVYFVLALGTFGLGVAAAGVLACATAYAWANEARYAPVQSIAIPIAYGITLAYLYIEGLPADRWVTLAPVESIERPLPFTFWLAEILAGAALIATVAVLVKRAGWNLVERRALLALAAAAAAALVSLRASGVAGGLMIVLLAFANGNRVLLGLGIAGLLYYLSRYYYLLDMTLLGKAGVLAATGLVLLGARWIVLRFVIVERAHA